MRHPAISTRILRRTAARGAVGALLLLAALFGCAQVPVGGALAGGPLRLSQVAHLGDPQRQASMSLCLSGLAADEAGNWARAEGLYERAIQLDSTNPFAYLALARHRVEHVEARAALDALGRAESLLPSDDAWIAERVQPHLLGLRARGLFLSGKLMQSKPLLDRARELAPVEWGDGQLSAAELR